MKNLLSVFSLIAVVALILSGCARPAARCTAPEDNPPHHYVSGMELIESGKLNEAAEKFERATYCDAGYGPAWGGLAIVRAMQARPTAQGEFSQADLDKVFDALDRAEKKAANKEEDFAYRIASIRVNTVLKPDRKWLSQAENDYKSAMKLKVDERKILFYEGREAAIYFMGAAYLEAHEFQAARDRFADVLNETMTGRWNAKADALWKRTDRLVRALSGVTIGDVGKEIALKDKVSRGDMAALLSDEVKVDKLFAGRIPVKSGDDKLKPGYTPVDIGKSPFKEEILTVMKWGVRGLQPDYDQASKAYLFRPDDPVDRKDFAFIIEDILIKITGDPKMASAYFGHDKSPFPDVLPTEAWYNAIMNVTTRNIMETGLSGEFRPDDPVDGAEAVLAVRVLKQRLNIY